MLFQPTKIAAAEERVRFEEMRIEAIIVGLLLASTFTTTGMADDCQQFRKASITLTGILRHVVFPGPPEYEDVKTGDEPEPRWVLDLKEPICVRGDPSSEFDSETVYDIRQIQLAHESWLGWYACHGCEALKDKAVIITGVLWGRQNGHHHTRVLLSPEAAPKQPNPGLQADAPQAPRP